MIDKVALKAEIDANPAKYSGKEDIQIANALNAPLSGVFGAKNAPTGEILKYLNDKDIYEKVRDLKGTNKKATSIIEFLTNPHLPEFNTTDPRFKKMSGLMVAAGIMTTQQKTELETLSQVPISRAEQLFGRKVHHLDVARAQGRG
ncbi:MAG: hypothetical protein ACE5IR_26035 [bacterium]